MKKRRTRRKTTSRRRKCNTLNHGGDGDLLGLDLDGGLLDVDELGRVHRLDVGADVGGGRLGGVGVVISHAV